MTPEKPEAHPSPDLFRNRLDNMLNHRHELYRLADLIDWSVFDTEFGVKAGITTTNKSNFVVGGMALPGNLFDGHTFTQALAQVHQMTGRVIEEAFVDRGYRGHGETQTTVYISGQRRGIKTLRLKCSLKRRQAIEPVINCGSYA